MYEENKRVFFNQNELAYSFGVDRTTITEYQRQGMPYKKGGRGNENAYDASICLYWVITKNLFSKWREEPPRKDALFFVIFSYAGNIEDDPYMTYPQWEKRALKMAEYMGYSTNDFYECIGFLKGIKRVN